MRRHAEARLAGSLDYWMHVYCPRPGDTVLDIGAGIGIDAMALSGLVGDTGRIYSLEAHPWTFFLTAPYRPSAVVNGALSHRGFLSRRAFRLCLPVGPPQTRVLQAVY